MVKRQQEEKRAKRKAKFIILSACTAFILLFFFRFGQNQQSNKGFNDEILPGAKGQCLLSDWSMNSQRSTSSELTTLNNGQQKQQCDQTELNGCVQATQNKQSDSKKETKEDESKQNDREQQETCIKSNRQDNEKQKSNINQKPPGTINVGLLNVRSLNKTKNNCRIPEVIKHLIIRNALDVFLSTETWLKGRSGNKVLEEASPPNFCFSYTARPSRPTFNVKQERKKGRGGVAIQYKQDLQGERRRTNRNPKTFEYVAAVIKDKEWNQPVLFINVYRPPGLTKTEINDFLKEFKSFFNELSESYNSIIITGDFNIHVDVETEPATKTFEEFLEKYKESEEKKSDLIQHVEQPTHQKGHTLDLVITRNVEISDLTVQDDKISDHYSVYFTMKPNDQTTKDKDDEEENVKRVKKTEE
ncbi:trichohyalin-like [Scomber scombrus]|uniref:Trichohyalin-like n=1 Tax=Scomber scombrus TaxID=13677 RepID=A0AAV1Q628_SCOSC